MNSKNSNNWHLKLFKKSILKQAKLKSILGMLGPLSEKKCLDLGGDNGIISYYLRSKGGSWYSADLEDEAVESIKTLVKENVYKIGGEKIPFEDSFFDTVVIIDYLEHIHTDRTFIEELHRATKPDAELIINVPNIKRVSLIRNLRNLLGLTAESHGHVREGYNITQLNELLANRFEVIKYRTYSRFFTEFIDTLIGFAYTNIRKNKKNQGRKGVLVTERDLHKSKRLFMIYSIVYPIIWILSKLDFLIFFTKGHSLIVKTKRL